jgi:hypothetical protein
MLRLVKVAARHVRMMFEAGDREQIVAIGRLPDVDQIYQPFTAISQITGSYLDSPSCPVMRMAGDADGALSPNLPQDLRPADRR